MTLYDKYFPVEDEAEDASIESRELEKRSMLFALVSASGWALFRDRLLLIVDDARDIKPGAEQEMLYQIGKKDAFMDVRELIARIEREAAAHE